MKRIISKGLVSVLLGFGCSAYPSPVSNPQEAVPLPTPEPEAAPRVAPVSSTTADSRQRWDSDPFRDRPFTLEDATKGLPVGIGGLSATIWTSMGALGCTLYDQKAPVAVANFVGLARGTRPWKDSRSGVWSARPAYNDTIFHRVIRGFMIQGGDPVGTGTGQPGYVFKDEIWDGSTHDRAGLLCMANRGHDTNGSQFFITDAASKSLDGNYTIFGECGPVEIVHSIASVAVEGSTPVTPVTIKAVQIGYRDLPLD